MKIAVRTLLAAAALTTIVRLPAQEAKRTLSLDEAIAVALTENPAMKAAEFEEKAATQERRAAIGLRMPKISVMGAYAWTGARFELSSWSQMLECAGVPGDDDGWPALWRSAAR